ncbi:MAG: hypothetical protein ABS77_07595 [Phenylobacterium sp. SCN 69-14]|nr:MAG: hypothetical protein ABS77_07595 [Phenylobacterium sp. SCN 69-14]
MDSDGSISLYLDLEKGVAPDFDVALKAALAWSTAVKEIAYVVDPGVQIRLEFDGTYEGSLGFNARLRAVLTKAQEAAQRVRTTATDPQVIRTAIVSATIWAMMNLAEYTFSRVMDHLTGADAAPEVQALSEADKTDIANRVLEGLRNEAARQPVRTMYRELERDPGVKGVGVTARPDARPTEVVPRSEFRAMSGRVVPKTQTIERRVVPERMRVVLVKPVLERGDRRWGFKGPSGEFGASIKHDAFIEAVLSGTTAVPMVEGIELTIDLETTEEFEGQVWVPKKREVVNVVDLHWPARPGDLFATP